MSSSRNQSPTPSAKSDGGHYRQHRNHDERKQTRQSRSNSTARSQGYPSSSSRPPSRFRSQNTAATSQARTLVPAASPHPDTSNYQAILQAQKIKDEIALKQSIHYGGGERVQRGREAWEEQEAREKLESMGDLLVPMNDEDDSTQYLRRKPDEIKACDMAFKEKGGWKKTRDERANKQNNGAGHKKRSKFFDNGVLRK